MEPQTLSPPLARSRPWNERQLHSGDLRFPSGKPNPALTTPENYCGTGIGILTFPLLPSLTSTTPPLIACRPPRLPAHPRRTNAVTRSPAPASWPPVCLLFLPEESLQLLTFVQPEGSRKRVNCRSVTILRL